ncbi:MAG: hypothetical protein ABIS50_15195 [Luteolibacter sp.]|uniref:hypothetical protein n=1 Tax=Luteolibacter sp. TaxID=1962973 RepID=UPI003264F359
MDPDQLAQPPTDAERRANWKAIHQMHPGNRFRLMFGLPLLPEKTPESGDKNPEEMKQAE